MSIRGKRLPLLSLIFCWRCMTHTAELAAGLFSKAFVSLVVMSALPRVIVFIWSWVSQFFFANGLLHLVSSKDSVKSATVCDANKTEDIENSIKNNDVKAYTIRLAPSTYKPMQQTAVVELRQGTDVTITTSGKPVTLQISIRLGGNTALRFQDANIAVDQKDHERKPFLNLEYSGNHVFLHRSSLEATHLSQIMVNGDSNVFATENSTMHMFQIGVNCHKCVTKLWRSHFKNTQFQLGYGEDNVCDVDHAEIAWANRLLNPTLSFAFKFGGPMPKNLSFSMSHSNISAVASEALKVDGCTRCTVNISSSKVGAMQLHGCNDCNVSVEGGSRVLGGVANCVSIEGATKIVLQVSNSLVEKCYGNGISVQGKDTHATIALKSTALQEIKLHGLIIRKVAQLTLALHHVSVTGAGQWGMYVGEASLSNVTVMDSHFSRCNLGVQTNVEEALFLNVNIQNISGIGLLVSGNKLNTSFLQIKATAGIVSKVSNWSGSDISVWRAFKAISFDHPRQGGIVDLSKLHISGGLVGIECTEDSDCNSSSLRLQGTVYFNTMDVAQSISAEGIKHFRKWPFHRAYLVCDTCMTISIFAFAVLSLVQPFPKRWSQVRWLTGCVFLTALGCWAVPVWVLTNVVALGHDLNEDVARQPVREQVTTFCVHAAAVALVCCILPRLTTARISSYWDNFRKKELETRRLHTDSLFKALESALWMQNDHAIGHAAAELQSTMQWTDAELSNQVKRLASTNSRNAGPSVAYLCSNEFQVLARSRTGLDDPSFLQMKAPFWLESHPIGGDVLCPRDGKLGCAFVDTLPAHHRGNCTHFLSWVWGYKLSTVQDSLQEWIVRNRLDPTSTFLYMCFFNNNQFRILLDTGGSGSEHLSELFENNLRPVSDSKQVRWCGVN